MSENIQVYMGRAGTGKTTACFKQIREIVEKNNQAKVILLSPDPITYKVERELVEFMPNRGFHSILVLGFARLAFQVLQKSGKNNDKMLSDIGRNLILRGVLKEHEKELSIFRKAAKQPKFAGIVQEMIKECQAFGILPEDLQKGAESVSAPLLQRKLNDLAILSKAYDDIMQERFAGVKDTMSELLEQLPSSEIIKDAYLFVDGYHWFTPQQLQILMAMFKEAKEVVITLTLPAEDYDKYKQQGSLFFRTWETYRDLKHIYGNKLQIIPFTENYRKVAPLVDGFFNFPAKRSPKDAKKTVLHSAVDKVAEVDYICRKILQEVEENGRRFKDFAIMLRDNTSYADEFEKAMNRYEIPFFCDYRHPMTSHPLAELIEGIFALCEHNYNHDPLFRILKTDFFPLKRCEVDELENYCLEFGVYEKDWQSDEDWIYCNKDFVKDGEESSETIRLARVNETRKIIKDLLDPLLNFAKKARTGASWAERIYEFLEELNVKATLSSWYKQEEEKGDMQEANGHLQMYKRILLLLEEIHLIAESDELTHDEMGLLLEEGINEVTYSIVPPTLDHVMVTSIERSYATEFPIVFIPGLNDGIFPRRMGDEGLLRDSEREELREQGIILAAGALVQAFNENYLLYLACSRAKEKLYLSYMCSDEENKPLEMSLIIRRLIQLGYCDEAINIPRDILAGTEANYIWRPLQSIRLLANKFLPLTHGEKVADIWWQLLQWGDENYPAETANVLRGVYDENIMPIIRQEIVEALLLRKNAIKGSVTRLERYNSCPFSFFAQYVLQLEPRKVRQFSSPEIGTYLHENLRAIGEYLLKNNKSWHDVPTEEMKELIGTLSDEIAKEMAFGMLDETAYSRNIKERLVKTLEQTIGRLQEWSARSSFSMVALEQSFGSMEKNSWPAVDIPVLDDKYVSLRGQIDRIDVWKTEQENYGLIIDYKSGNQGIEAQDVYYGLKLQLLTYLLALENAHINKKTGIKGMPYLPAGLVYTFVQNPKISCKEPLTHAEAAEYIDKKELENSGYFSNNIDILTGIDNICGISYSPYVPIKFKKDGEINKTSLSKVKSIADFNNMMQYTKKTIAKTGEAIVKGQFPIKPYRIKNNSPCKYCKYQTVCRFDISQGDTNYRHLAPLKEAEAMEKIITELQDKKEEGGSK